MQRMYCTEFGTRCRLCRRTNLLVREVGMEPAWRCQCCSCRRVDMSSCSLSCSSLTGFVLGREPASRYSRAARGNGEHFSSVFSKVWSVQIRLCLGSVSGTPGVCCNRRLFGPSLGFSLAAPTNPFSPTQQLSDSLQFVQYLGLQYS
jgi:hypothetical protein